MATERVYWAMRTCRDDERSRDFIKTELLDGRLRQGWGSDDKLDLRVILKEWDRLDKDQVDASRHWRMANGSQGVYMNVDDVVLVPNMPDDGFFTLCRICGCYDYGPENDLRDFRHIRPVEVLTPDGVANEHELVSSELRKSLRCRSRLWNVTAHGACIEQILSSDRSPEDLRQGSTPVGRAQSIVSDAIVEPISVMAQRLGDSLPQKLYGAEWEQAVGLALESLFAVTVNHTGGLRIEVLTWKSSFQTLLLLRKTMTGSFPYRSRTIRELRVPMWLISLKRRSSHVTTIVADP